VGYWSPSIWTYIGMVSIKTNKPHGFGRLYGVNGRVYDG
jgi:hypothetical protein